MKKTFLVYLFISILTFLIVYIAQCSIYYQAAVIKSEMNKLFLFLQSQISQSGGLIPCTVKAFYISFKNPIFLRWFYDFHQNSGIEGPF